MVLYPHLEERGELLHALDPASKAEVGGWFGSNSLPRFDDLTHIRMLDPSLVPVAQIEGEARGSRSERRLVVVGDVHGCKEECTSPSGVCLNPATLLTLFSCSSG